MDPVVDKTGSGFSACGHFRKHPETALHIGFVGDSQLLEALAYDAKVLEFGRPASPFIGQPPVRLHFTLVSPASSDGGERQRLLDTIAGLPAEFSGPLVLWHRTGTGGSDARPWRELADLACHLFADNQQLASAYTDVMGRACHLLEPAVQPGLVHPYAIGDRSTVASLPDSKSVGTFLAKRRQQHARWRQLLKQDTIALRLDQICKQLEINSGRFAEPRVSVYVPTFRVDFLGRILRNFDKQTYANRQLVIVLHTDLPIPDEVRTLVADRPDVSVERLSRSHGVGACMNLALQLADGEFAVKMDDDDEYGANFIEDMVLPLRAVNADIFGKPPYFVYSEAGDRTYLRYSGIRSENRLVSSQALSAGRARMSGATHSGRTRTLREIGFDARNLGAADTAFFERCATLDIAVGLWDGFNISAYRASDPLKHTWRLEDRVLLKDAVPVGTGLCRDLVEI